MKHVPLFNKYNDGHWKSRSSGQAERFAEFLKEKKFSGLLVDLGCGNGRDVAFFNQAGIRSVGFDYDPVEVIEAAALHRDCKFEVQNAEKLKLPDESVGAYFMINVMHYVDKEAAIGEIRRALKPRGYAFISFNLSITDVNGETDYQFSPDEALKLVSDFQIVSQRVYETVDLKPIKHTHEIMELILQKI